MAKFIFRLVIYIMAIVFLLLFTSCTYIKIDASDGENGNKKSDEFILYTDSDPIENDFVKIETQKPSCYGSESFSLSLSFKITNKEHKTKEFIIKGTKLTKESTGAEYSVTNSILFGDKFQIESELNKSIYFSSTIPTSIKVDNYKLSLEINEYKITYYFYETPDELRVDRTISYYVDNSLVKTEIVKDKRKIESLLFYESEDNLSYCSTWYIDESRKNEFNKSMAITSDLNLYGYSLSNIRWLTTSSDVYSFVNYINHIPSNGIIVIPRKNQNKEICIGAYVFTNMIVSKIYIPKTVHIIYGGNFTRISNVTIYYEGTEEEWKSLFYDKNDVVTTNVIYNTYID